jgi:hypothetical protein
VSKLDYNKTKGTASTLIDKFGKTLSKKTVTSTGSAFDPTVAYSEPISIIGVITALKKDEYDGTLILRTDKKMLTTYEILSSDKVIDGSVTYDVIDISILEPANVKVLYKVILRG